MKFFARTAAGPGSVVPRLATWRDVTGRLALELPLPVIHEIYAACNGPSPCVAGVLVGTIRDCIRVHYAFPLELDGKGDLSSSAREWLLSCSPGNDKIAATVGLFATDTQEQPSAIQRVAAAGSGMLPASMPVLIVGRQSVAVFLWQAAPDDLVPLSPELSFHQPPVPDAPDYSIFADAPGELARTSPRPAGKSHVTTHFGFQRWVWAAAVLLAVLAFAVGRFWLPADRAVPPDHSADAVPPSRTQLGFQVSRHGTDLLLSWDRDLARTLGARSGLLQIRDGGVSRAVPITDTDLTSGQILYVPGLQDIEITLVVFTGSGIIRENVKILQAGKIGPTGGQLPRPETGLPRTSGPAPEPQPTAAIPPVIVPRAVPAPLTETEAPASPPETEPVQSVARVAPEKSGEPLDAARKSIGAPQQVQAAAIPDEQVPTPAPQPSPAVTSRQFAAAVPTRQVAPIMPASFKTLLFRDTVVKVKVSVDTEGKVSSAQAAPETPAALRYMSEDAGRRWRFRPATLDGKAVSSEYFINFTFKR
jgi:periplasmic protein TonB